MKRGILFIFLILLLPNVLAMGLRGRNLNFQMDFVPNTDHTYQYQLVTNSGFTQDYELYVIGDLNYTVSLEPQMFYSVPDGAMPYFTATLHFPENIETPGIHELRIGARESQARGGGMIGARTAAEAIIRVRVLYPGSHLLAKLTAPSVNVHEPVNFIINLENWGKADIVDAHAIITVYDSNNRSVSTLITESISVPNAGNSQLFATLDTIGLLPGGYWAEAVIDWDDNQTKIKSNFKIGELTVDISSYTRSFELGKISPFNIVIESGWNDPIENVFAEIIVNDVKMITPTISLNPWESKIITAYLDATNLKAGDYDTEIVLHYGGNIATKKVKISVQEFKDGEPVQAATLSTMNLIVILIILLVIANILWLMFIQKKNSGEVKI